MKLAIFQPYFFPYIGYFQLIRSVDKFILYDHLNFIERGWITRNRISAPGGKEVYIQVPVEKKSSNRLINELTISDATPWQRKLLKQLRYTYGKYPFYHELFPFFEALLTREYTLLSELNCQTIKAVAGLLDIRTEITCGSSDYCRAIENELAAGEYTCEKKTQRILLICRKEKADTFVNAIGGQNLYSKPLFKAHGIDLFFLKTNESAEKQSMPGLSIIEVLFHYGTEGTKRLLNGYELI